MRNDRNKNLEDQDPADEIGNSKNERSSQLQPPYEPEAVRHGEPRMRDDQRSSYSPRDGNYRKNDDDDESQYSDN